MFLIVKLLNYNMYSRMQRRLCPKKYGWYFLSIADCAVQSIQTLVFTWYRWKSIHSEVGTAPLFSSGATSAAVFLIAEAEAPLLFSANSEKRQRRYI